MPLRRLNNAKDSEPVGALDKRIRLVKPGRRNQDGGDQPPAPIVDLPAEVRAPGTGAEMDKVSQITQVVKHVVRIPYHSGVTQDMILVYEGRNFQIDFIEDRDEFKVWLYIYCSEIGQNAGANP